MMEEVVTMDVIRDQGYKDFGHKDIHAYHLIIMEYTRNIRHKSDTIFDIFKTIVNFEKFKNRKG